MSKNNNYARIQNFGSSGGNASVDNPLTYSLNDTIDQRFIHGNDIGFVTGQHSKNSQSFLSEYCAQNFDGFCQLASQNQSISWPNNIASCNSGGGVACAGLTAGEILIQNTAAKKYLISMANCIQKFEPFDPTVADSPMISTWESDQCTGGGCVPSYAVDPTQIDNDIVMNKILSKPVIAIDILINIYNTMTRDGSISKLSNTKLGKFYAENLHFFKKK